jgi:N-acetylglucosaminyldiphosphoundecaprenol N-acetyl-beta-D-mannosaminyltransferase
MVASRKPHYVVTANADFLAQSRQDVELRRILVNADLVLCDGTPLVWASRLLGNSLPERVAGSDLTPLLIELAAERNYRLFLLGASPEANAQAVARLRRQHPALNIVGSHAPPFKPLLEMDHDEIQRRIRAVKPDLLFVSFGCPKQEKWIAMQYQALGVPVTIGVGATIDFLAGRVKRAPQWMQRAGLEWVFRLLQEPRRLFKRYASDFRHFGTAIVAQCWQTRWRPCRVRQTRPSCPIVVEPAWQRVRVSERLDVHSIRRDAVWSRILSYDRHCLLDLTETRFIDSTGIGLLVHLHKRLGCGGHQLILVSPGAAVRRLLALMRLEDCFEVASDAIEARAIIERRNRERSAQVVVNGETRPLAWRGEITALNAEAVWEATRAQIERLGTARGRLSIDISDLRFIDSTGLGVLIRAKKFARQHECELRFVGIQPGVRNVLRLSRLESLLASDAA